MPNIITPLTLWNNFDDSLDVAAIKLDEKVSDGIKFEYASFLGRETGEGRVKVYGVYACNAENPSSETVLIFPDSEDTVDEELLKLFVKRGYSAFMVDYRGEWEGANIFTLYPRNIDYANTARCGRRKDYVDETADKTCWYEWVAVGIYARKFVVARSGSDNIAVVGLRDGGEIAWKLGVASKFSCIVPVCAAGWKAYSGASKYRPDELTLDEERYRFIGGIDSQAYAPYVRCPVLMLCSTNDRKFDYDRAFDTFSRINHDYADESVINYSMRFDSSIGEKSTSDMFMYLDKYLKHRQVFIPRPADVNVSVDEEDNLVATASFDGEGVVEEAGMFMAEDCAESSIREWAACPQKRKISESEREFFLNVYEKSTYVYALCYAKYTSGFTVWSRIVVKKLSGKFRNMQGKCRVMFTSKNGADGFSVTDIRSCAVGGIFFPENSAMPQIVTKGKGIKGVYSPCGLTTYRINNPRYSPEEGNVLKLDVYCDESSEITFTLEDVSGGETYRYSQSVLGGVWQSIILESKMIKTANGTALAGYTQNLRLSIACGVPYAVNNVMWL